MPFHFYTHKDNSKFTGYKSVLIVPCRFCPAASFSVTNHEPYFDLFRKFLATESYERYIEYLRSELEKEGIKTNVFKSKLIHQFVLCMWTSKRRKKLAEWAKNYESIIVLGCEAAVKTIKDSVKNSSCKVFQGLETKGLMSIQPKFHVIGKISLELESLTPLMMLNEDCSKFNIVQL